MKAHLLKGTAGVFANPDSSSPQIGTLTSETIFDVGEAIGNKPSEWTDVLLTDGTHGFVSSELNVEFLRGFRLAVSGAQIHLEASCDSVVSGNLQYGDNVLASRPVKGKGGDWVAVYALDGEKRGFVHVDTFMEAKEFWEVFLCVRSCLARDVTRELVSESLSKLDWMIESTSETTITARNEHVFGSKTTLVNIGIGILRFCVWPLIYFANPRASVFDGSFFNKPSVSAFVATKRSGAVVCLRFPSPGLYGVPCLNDLCKKLLTELEGAFGAQVKSTGSFENQAGRPAVCRDRVHSPVSEARTEAATVDSTSEIKFECRICGQHIICGHDAKGQEVRCPTCESELSIPDKSTL